ncbi:MAG: glycosyltransferase family 39 protein [Elusimicrobia bacterium]|nr:glycosyltransferase family 39 protein [Elusimicrobiota bacterium]
MGNIKKIREKKVERKSFFPDWFIWSVAGIWGFIVLKNYYSIFKPNFNNLEIMLSLDQYLSIFNFGNFLIFKHLLSIFLAVFFFFSAFAAGRLVLLRAGLVFFNFLEEIAFSVALGLGIIAYLILLIGAIGFLSGYIIYIIVLAFFIIGIIDLKNHPSQSIFPKEKLSMPAIIATVILVVAMLINLSGALSPEIFYDSLVYHLGVPNFYKIHHKIANMPFVFLSNLPAVASMLFTTGLFIKDEIVAKLINYGAGIFTCLVILSISIRYFNLKAGIYASLIFYTITHVMIGSWSCGSEALLAFFGLISLYGIINFSDKKKIWLILSAIFAGIAMGIKYTGLFVAIGVAAAYIFSYFPSLRKTVNNIIIWGLISFAVVSPWLVKNYIYKKNPVYPYMSGLFPKDSTSDYEKLKGFIAEARQFGTFSLLDWVKHPWNITMGKIPNSEHFTPLFLMLFPLIFLLGHPPGILKYFIVYFLVVWITWSVSSTMIRFMMPAYPAAGIIIAYYLAGNFYKSLKKILLLMVLFVCAVNVYWAGWIYYIQGGWQVVVGKQSKKDFLSTTHSSYPYGYYAATEFINKNLPKDAKVLFIGEGRSFYIDRMPIVSSAHDLTPIVEFAKSSKSADELYLKIKQEGITHIFFNMGEAIRLGKSYKMFQWDEKSLDVYNEFWKKYVKEIFNKDEVINGNFANRVAVYEILSEKEAAIPHVPPFNLMTEVVVKNINR